MKIVAIDFEDTGYKDFAVSVGIVEIENGVRTEFKSFINPETSDENWLAVASAKHKLKPHDVANAPNFKDIWPEIQNRFEGSLVIAHWVQSDMNVIRKNIIRYGINFSDFYFLDTWDVAKLTWPELENHKLKTLAGYLNIDLDHHEALSDARACLEILLAACDENLPGKPSDFVLQHETTDLRSRLFNREVLNQNIQASLRPSSNLSGQSRSDYTSRRTDELPLKSGLPLLDKTFVFTGNFRMFDKAYAETVVAQLGGSVQKGSITKTLHYLVCGWQDQRRLKEGALKSTKELRVDQLNLAGADIQCLTEDEFLEMVTESDQG